MHCRDLIDQSSVHCLQLLLKTDLFRNFDSLALRKRKFGCSLSFEI